MRHSSAGPAGDIIAAYQCCWHWHEHGLATNTLPAWVLNHLAGSAARYFAAGPFTLPNAEPASSNITPKRLLQMKPKERARAIPSLDKMAGLSGTRGKQNAWSWCAEHARDPYLAAYLEKLAEDARKARKDKKIIDIYVRVSDGREITVLDRQGRLRDEVRDHVGNLFNIGGYGGQFSTAKSVRRRTGQSKTDK